jgi:hypothetical protein
VTQVDNGDNSIMPNVTIGQIFPDYSMTPTVATKAAIDNAVDCSSHPIANDSKALIGGITLRVLDAAHFDGAAAGGASVQITVNNLTGSSNDVIALPVNGGAGVTLTGNGVFGGTGGMSTPSDLATQIKNFINTNHSTDLTAEAAGAVVTVTQVAGGVFEGTPTITSPSNTYTASGDFAGGTAAITAVTAGASEVLVKVQGSAANTRNKVKLAINGAQADTDVGYGSGTTIEDGIDGYTATNGGTANTVKLEAEDAGATTILTLLSDLTTAQSATGTADTGAIAIPLSNLDQPNNAFTIAEADGANGDFRKFLFHTLQKYVDYLATLEALNTVAPAAGYAGTGYAQNDVITVSGGGGTGAAAKVATVGASGEVLTCTVTSSGSGFTTTPSGSIASAGGSGCILELALTTESPANMVITSTSLQAASDSTASKSYTVQFNFSIGALDVSSE